MDLMDTAHVHDHDDGDDDTLVNSGPFSCATHDPLLEIGNGYI